MLAGIELRWGEKELEKIRKSGGKRKNDALCGFRKSFD
jgi:hypothetical protein